MMRCGLLFDWNMAGFNDTAIADCRNGVAGQNRAAIVANLVAANEATNYGNMNVFFTFRDGAAIGTCAENVNQFSMA